MIQKRAFSIIAICPILLIIGLFFSIKFGSVDLTLQDVWNTFFHYDKDNLNQLIITTTRLPRAIGAIVIGALLAI